MTKLLVVIVGLITFIVLPSFAINSYLRTGSINTPAYSQSSAIAGKPKGKAKQINSFISNPAAIYCSDLGYRYLITKDDFGQRGLCAFPDHTVCDAWEFLEGKCGQAYTYCAKHGYGVQLKTDGRDSFTREYGVCISPQGSEVGSVVELSGLAEKVVHTGCNSSDDQLPSLQESVIQEKNRNCSAIEG